MIATDMNRTDMNSESSSNAHGEGRRERDGEIAVPAGMPLDGFLPHLLNRIANQNNIDLGHALRPIGLTQQNWRVLLVLAAGDGRTISELGLYTVMPQSTLSRLIERMERDDLVRKAGQEDDGRCVRVFLTRKGRSYYDKAQSIAMRHFRRAVAGVPEADLMTTIETLQAILRNIRIGTP